MDTRAQALLLVLGVGLTVGVGVSMGVVSINDDPQHLGSAFDMPEAGVNDTTIESAGSEHTTFRIWYWVDNPNPIDGEVTNVEYELHWSKSKDGTYEHMGDGETGTIEIPANTNISNHTDARLESDQALQAETARQTQGYIWVRFDATFHFGSEMVPKEFEYDLSKKMRVE